MANAIEEYVGELGRALRGPRHAKADLLTEACDSLHDAAVAYEDVGLSRHTAERRAVADFGAIGEIAPAYQGELAITQSRRTVRLMLAVVGLQPLLWQDWWPWFAAYPDDVGGAAYVAVNQAVEWFGAITIVALLLAAYALGAGTRHIGPYVGRYAGGDHRALTRLVGGSTLVLCGVFASLGVTLCVLSPHQTLAAGLMWLTPFLLLPLSAVAGAARRCLALA